MIKLIARTRRHTATRSSAVLTLLVALLAITFVQFPLGTTRAKAVENYPCPGGDLSGRQGWPCPNVRNENLLNQRALPMFAFRGDSRTPNGIFRDGFRGYGRNTDIVNHLRGDRSHTSNYVSTSGRVDVAIPFARSQGLRNLEDAARRRCAQIRALQDARRGWASRYFPTRCQSATITADTYVYEIDTFVARNAFYMPHQVRGNANLYNQYLSQHEFTYVHRIQREAIRGARVYRMTATANGDLIDMRSIRMNATPYRYERNPFYNGNATPYRPNDDGNSQFSYWSELNIPRIPENPYTRGCSRFFRCRGGSGGN